MKGGEGTMIPIEPSTSPPPVVPSARPDAAAVGEALPAAKDDGRREKEESKALTVEQEKVVHDLKASLADPDVRVTFVQIPGVDEPVIRVVNRETGEVLRQIPPQDVIELRQRFTDLMGLIEEREA
jgi:uncharacterized FlaG/YvyC family protein